MKTNYKYIIWDWNGTLFDDAWLCHEIMNSLMKRRDMKTINLAEYKKIYQIPFKNSPSYESLVIVPINSKYEQIRSISSSFSEYINELKYLRATAPSPYTQQKYEDSLDFLYDVSGDWMVTLRMEGFGPIHEISMWV